MRVRTIFGIEVSTASNFFSYRKKETNLMLFAFYIYVDYSGIFRGNFVL